ncbi:MAG: NAD-dependent epimerase/dehydratase family protein [Propionibacteriaceae bacterium]|nr:NAD-dependent epimerase/dehydratase family protein [Propionibacteriaceae bacterium]
MRILLLGGTAFLGRTIARHAVAAGVDVTCLARGTQPAPEQVTFITADRDDEHALDQVRDTIWDAVIDLTSTPGHARRAAAFLATKHWLYVSSASVYRSFEVPGQDESAPLLDPLAADVMADMSQYGAAKVACENAFRDTELPLTVFRPGLIGGDGDFTGRSGYYPWRFAHPTGNDVLTPRGDQLASLIDVEDLARWIVHCVTEQVTGTFNVAGEAVPLTQLLTTSREVAGSSATAREVVDEQLLAHGIQPWAGPRSLPLWLPLPEFRFAAALDVRQALAGGLRIRPLSETLAAALRYEEQREVPRLAGLTDAEEIELRNQLDARD